MRRLLMLGLGSLLTVTISAFAHHSFPAHYFEEQSVTVQGELVEFEYKSPHAWVHVMVKDSSGQAQKYSAEWSNPSRLQQLNITKDTLKAGDLLIITGAPGRNATERNIHLKAIERPADGWKWGARRTGV
jgi:uncharacterized protein DUF6152